MIENQSFWSRHGSMIVGISGVAIGAGGLALTVVDRNPKKAIVAQGERLTVVEKTLAVHDVTIKTIRESHEKMADKVDELGSAMRHYGAMTMRIGKSIGLDEDEPAENTKVRPLNRSVAKPKAAVGTEG